MSLESSLELMGLLKSSLGELLVGKIALTLVFIY